MRKIFVLLVLLLVSGCMQPEPEELGLTEDVKAVAEDAGPVGEEPAGLTVSIRGFAFHPAEITVEQGETVTWTNEDGVPHTVKFGEDFESQTLMGGGRFQYTFTEPGEYPYICGIHPSMQGKVIVE